MNKPPSDDVMMMDDDTITCSPHSLERDSLCEILMNTKDLLLQRKETTVEAKTKLCHKPVPTSKTSNFKVTQTSSLIACAEISSTRG